jgi:hypothetical protein
MGTLALSGNLGGGPLRTRVSAYPRVLARWSMLRRRLAPFALAFLVSPAAAFAGTSFRMSIVPLAPGAEGRNA